MRLQVLGSSGGYPAPGNPSSGFLLEHGGAKIWIDAGHGTFAELQRLADFTRIDALVLSHGHADHCVDAFALHVALRYAPQGARDSLLPLYCPPGVREKLGHFLGEGGVEELGRAFDFHTIDVDRPTEIAGARFSFLRMDHPIHTLGIRIETSEGTLTYSADTGPKADLAGFARGSDLLLCEACYQDAAQGGPVHLTARQAGETARRAGVRELAVTHIWPTLDPKISLEEARAGAGDVPVRWARPGEVFETGKGRTGP
jgi:ribonuclease BN (tRNA processing enzyme)